MKLSVITATWNCAATFGDCLASVAGQSYSNREHLLIDGASTDGTCALLESHRDQLAALLSEPDEGIYDALNKGLARARGQVIGVLHADDVYADAEVLVRMRVGGASNRLLGHIVRKSWDDYPALRTNRIGGVGAFAWKNVSKLPQFWHRAKPAAE